MVPSHKNIYFVVWLLINHWNCQLLYRVICISILVFIEINIFVLDIKLYLKIFCEVINFFITFTSWKFGDVDTFVYLNVNWFGLHILRISIDIIIVESIETNLILFSIEQYINLILCVVSSQIISLCAWFACWTNWWVLWVLISAIIDIIVGLNTEILLDRCQVIVDELVWRGIINLHGEKKVHISPR